MSLLGFKAQNHPQQVRAAHKTGNERRWRGGVDADDRATTADTFEPLAARFGGFTLDVAAAAHNTKCPRYYDASLDGLSRSWADERVWCNPPYSNIQPWVERAWTAWSSRTARPELIVMLLPANRTEQTWWQDLVEPRLRIRRTDFGVEFLRGRIRFLKPGQNEVGPNERPPFGCCLLIWADGYGYGGR